MLKKLQDVIKHDNPDIVAGRKLAIKRWVETHIENIKYFKDDKLEFLYNVFRDEACWSGIRLNNTVLGQRLTEEKIGEIDNPLRMYEMACSYCVVGKILPLFQKRFESYKNRFPSGAFDGKAETEIGKYVRNSLLDSIKRKGPVFDFWIDRESGELKQPSSASEGFDSAVKLKWSEGVEYFYNLLKKDEEDKGESKEKESEKKLTEAIIVLSRVKSVKKDAPILDFCVNNTTDKGVLLQKLLRKDKGVYALLAELIDSCFFDTVHDLVQSWCYKGDHSNKIFSQRDYEVLLSSLSDVMLENPESSIQARSLIMEFWKCDRLGEYRKATVIDTSNNRVPIELVLGALIINWKRSACSSDEEKEMLNEMSDIVLFAKDCFPERFEFFKERVIKNLRLCGREGKIQGMDYGKLAEELFPKLERKLLLARKYGSGDGPGSELKFPGVSSAGSRKRKLLPAGNYGSGDEPGSKLESPDVSPSGSPERKRAL